MPGDKRVLIVDDDEATLTVFRKILTADQWDVDSATSGRQAAEKVRGIAYDAVVSDLYMPDMNGMEFYEAALRISPGLRGRIVFVSGYADSDLIKKFLLENGCPSLRKPIRIDEFRQVVAQLAAGKPLEAAALPSPWFTPESIHLYSGEVRGHHTVFNLLNRIYTARLTGVLVVQTEAAERKLYFNLGQLVSASSDAESDGLAIATSVFDSTAGRYYFYDSFDESIVPEVGIASPVGQLLLPAVRQSPDLPLDELARDEFLAVDLSPDPLLSFQNVDLDAAERAILSIVVRPMSAADLFRASGLPLMQAAHKLYALLALGMIVAVAPQQSAAAAPIPQAVAEAAAPRSIGAAPEAAPEPVREDPGQFGQEINSMLERLETDTHYQLLGVRADINDPAVFKQSFYRLARRFHPDRHMGHSEWIDSLQKIMDGLTVAYKTLTDAGARAQYDKRQAEAGAYAFKREKTKKEETAEECLEKAKQCLRAQNFAGSIIWLRKCVEIAPTMSKYRAMLARSLAAVPQYRRDAVEEFQRAIDLDNWNLSAYLQLGELYEQMALPWRARPLYQKIIDIDPEHAKAKQFIARVDEKTGKKKKSVLAAVLSVLSALFKRK